MNESMNIEKFCKRCYTGGALNFLFMPTKKKRVNVTLDKEIEEALLVLSERDQMSQSAKAAQLIRMAVEIDEDDVLNKIAEERDSKNSKFLSHDDVWK